MTSDILLGVFVDMNKHIFVLALFFCVFLFHVQVKAHRSCGAMDAMEASFQGDENRRAEFYDLHRKVQQITRNQQHLHERAIEQLRIPVVFHILQNANVPVITVAQINQEMEWLNDWYTAANVNYGTSSTFWTDDIATASDFGISFELASFDPNGDPTTGIIFYQGSTIADTCDGDNFYVPASGGSLFVNILSFRIY